MNGQWYDSNSVDTEKRIDYLVSATESSQGDVMNISHSMVSGNINFTEVLTSDARDEGLRSVCADSKSKYSESIKRREIELVKDTCAYLDKHLDRKFMLVDIANLMGTNRSKLAATFKQVLGVSVFEWIREQRLQLAKKLLIESEMSVQQIACEIGYDSCANFSTAYKKRFKKSPSFERKD